MSEIKPRFEFRTFAQNFGLVTDKMRRLSPIDKIRESNEIYIMSHGNNENNIKIRCELLEIKVFVKAEKGLQQWNHRMKVSFPMTAEMIEKEVFSAFGVTMPKLQRSEYTLSQFLKEIIRPHKNLVPAHVCKRRYGFMVNDCMTEHAELLINGDAIQTVAVEAVDLDAILKAKEMLGLTEYENVNYLTAIKRMIGMESVSAHWSLGLVQYLK